MMVVIDAISTVASRGETPVNLLLRVLSLALRQAREKDDIGFS
jgi:hypothetical protein